VLVLGVLAPLLLPLSHHVLHFLETLVLLFGLPVQFILLVLHFELGVNVKTFTHHAHKLFHYKSLALFRENSVNVGLSISFLVEVLDPCCDGVSPEIRMVDVKKVVK